MWYRALHYVTERHCVHPDACTQRLLCTLHAFELEEFSAISRNFIAFLTKGDVMKFFDFIFTDHQSIRDISQFITSLSKSVHRHHKPCLPNVVMQQSSVSPLTSTELLKQLHWLPIEWRIRLKLACLVHKILNTGHPPYVTELLQYHKPARSTRSSASHLLSVPRHNLSFGARAFRVATPKIWNSIPVHIRQSQTYSSFRRRHLKTHYFLAP